MAAATVARGARATHLRIVGLVLGKNLFPHFLSALVDVRVQLVAILLYAELLVVVDWNVNFLSAWWLFLWIVELSNVRMLQGLLGSKSLVRVELEKTLQQVQGIVTGVREHVAKFLWLGGRQRIEHGRGKRTVDGVHILLGGPSGHFHDSIQLIEGRGSWENWFAKQQLGQDATHTPHVNALGVLV